MTKPNYQKTTFILSAADLSQLPEDSGSEVAFVGRSNAGKSSVLNQLTQNKKLARVSKTPGRTQLINLFAITPDKRLADLPGYGYAKVSIATQRTWQALIESYLQERASLKGLVLVMDIRHPLTPVDQNFIAWANASNLPVHILLNKADKLSASAAKQTLLKVQKHLATLSTPCSVQCFSALKQTGLEGLHEKLGEWWGS